MPTTFDLSSFHMWSLILTDDHSTDIYSSLAPLWQVLRRSCLFQPRQSWAPLIGHCCPWATPHSNCHIPQLIALIKVFMSILESICHKLLVAHDLTLVTPNIRDLEVFSTLRALTHTRITWALLPTAPQVPNITPGPPCANGVSGTPHQAVHDVRGVKI